jgi:hypothetical protein
MSGGTINFGGSKLKKKYQSSSSSSSSSSKSKSSASSDGTYKNPADYAAKNPSPPKTVVVGFKKDSSGKISDQLLSASQNVKTEIASRTTSSGKRQTVDIKREVKGTTYYIQDSKAKESISRGRVPSQSFTPSFLESANKARGQSFDPVAAKNLTFSRDMRPTLQIVEKKTGLEGLQQSLTSSRQKLRTDTQRNAGTSTLLSAGSQFGLGIASSAIGTALFAKEIITKPVQTTKALGGVALGFGKKLLSGDLRVSESVAQTIKQEPFFAGGFISGELLTAKGSGAVFDSAGKLAKNVYIKTGSEFIKPESVFSPRVLSGKENLPTVKGVDESLNLFKESKGVVQTSSPQKITGTEAGIGKKASTGFEDSGIYVTPKGQGSPYFLGIEAGEKTSKYTLNPFKTKMFSSIPTVTEFKSTGVELIPRSVVAKPGFTAVQDFFETQSGSGKVFITKRSELGQGNLARQFNPETKALEAGTSELEAIVPYKQQFSFSTDSFAGKVKGFDSYTTFGGDLVAIRRADLVTNKVSSVVDSSKARIISGSTISKETSSLSSLQEGVSYKTPFSTRGSSSLLPSSRNTSSLSNITSSKPSPSLTSSGISGSSTSSSSGMSIIFDPASSVPLSKTSSSSRRSSGRSSGSSGSSGGSIISDPSPLISGGSGGSSGGSSKIIFKSTPYFPKDKYKPLIPNLDLPSSEKSQSLFNLDVGRKGAKYFSQFKGLGLSEAGTLGKRGALSSAAATVKITGVGGRTLSRSEELKVSKLLGSSFRKGKGDSNSFVQKRGTRIGSSGELKEITFEGIRASKKSSKKKKKKKGGKSPLRSSSSLSLSLLSQGKSLRSIRSLL